jgi:hypothetical protein
MSDESDRHDDQVDALGGGHNDRAAGDGGITLDAFWARIDPPDA